MDAPPSEAPDGLPAPPAALPSAPFFLLEVFCGRAVLSHACAAVGLAACGVGFYHSTVCLGPAVKLDLSSPWAQSLLIETIKCNLSSSVVWLAPPAGTLSKARNRPIKDAWRAAGVPESPALRSSGALSGLKLAWQSPELAAQLERANTLVAFTFFVIKLCDTERCPWYVSNPLGSYLWEFPQWGDSTWSEVDIALCAYGAPRPSPIRIRCSNSWLASVTAACPGTHKHVPWTPAFGDGRFKGFSNGVDAGFLPLLAAKIVESLRAGSSAQSGPPAGLAEAAIFSSAVAVARRDDNKVRVAKIAAAAHRQARGRRLDQLVPEFKVEHAFLLPVKECSSLQKRLRFTKPTLLGSTLLPKDSQITLVSTRGDLLSCDVRVGVPWTPAEFLLRAKTLEHPYASLCVPNEVADAVFTCCTLGPAAISEHRQAFFERWERRASELEDDERKLCATLHPDLQEFAKAKRPLLLKEILYEANFPAADLLVSFILEGFPMFGPFPATSVFPRRSHAASLNVQQLLKTAKWARPALLGSASPPRSDETLDELWRLTLEEREKGECRGPFTAAEMDARHPDGWLAAKRFAVIQKGKVRPCDDYSAYGHNATSSSEETIDTDGPDSIVGVAKLWAQALACETVRLKMASGYSRRGFRHKSVAKPPAKILKARLIDLKRAYKQLARRPEEAPLAVFALQTAEGDWKFFEAVALGFGARNSVLCFNLAARALRHVMNVLLYIAATHFYDDFSHIEADPYSDCAAKSVERLLALLGWSWKSGPDDLKPPASSFAPLGVQIDLSSPGFAVVANTDKRKSRIAEEVDRLVALRLVPEADLHSLVGVCQFAEAQCCGRTGALALRAVRRAIGVTSEGATERLRAALRELSEHVLSAAPRRIPLLCTQPPVLVLSDAAFEGGVATLGAVVFDPSSKTFEFFEATFSTSTVAMWQRDAVTAHSESPKLKEQIICQAELAAVVVAVATWAELLSQRDVLLFVDNDPAKDALVNGSSRSSSSSEMVRFCRLLCARHAIAPWFDRVPSPSNIADGPSRGDCEVLVYAGAVRVAPMPVPDLALSFS